MDSDEYDDDDNDDNNNDEINECYIYLVYNS